MLGKKEMKSRKNMNEKSRKNRNKKSLNDGRLLKILRFTTAVNLQLRNARAA
jgi:hypothetical protein